MKKYLAVLFSVFILIAFASPSFAAARKMEKVEAEGKFDKTHVTNAETVKQGDKTQLATPARNKAKVKSSTIKPKTGDTQQTGGAVK